MQDGSLAGGGVEIIGVAGRDEIEAMTDFVSQLDVAHIPHVADTEGLVWSGFEIISQPSWVFLNDDGSIEVVVGGLGHDTLRERIEELAAT